MDPISPPFLKAAEFVLERTGLLLEKIFWSKNSNFNPGWSDWSWQNATSHKFLQHCAILCCNWLLKMLLKSQFCWSLVCMASSSYSTNESYKRDRFVETYKWLVMSVRGRTEVSILHSVHISPENLCLQKHIVGWMDWRPFQSRHFIFNQICYLELT